MKGVRKQQRGYLQKVRHRQRSARNVDECFEITVVQPSLIEGVATVHILVGIDCVQNDTRIQVFYLETRRRSYVEVGAAQ